LERKKLLQSKKKFRDLENNSDHDIGQHCVITYRKVPKCFYCQRSCHVIAFDFLLWELPPLPSVFPFDFLAMDRRKIFCKDNQTSSLFNEFILWGWVVIDE